MIIGATVFGYIIGNVAVIMENFDVVDAIESGKMNQIKDWLYDRKVYTTAATRDFLADGTDKTTRNNAVVDCPRSRLVLVLSKTGKYILVYWTLVVESICSTDCWCKSPINRDMYGRGKRHEQQLS